MSDPSPELIELNGVMVLDEIRFEELSARAASTTEPVDAPEFGLRCDVEEMDDLASDDRRQVRFNVRVDLTSTEGRIAVVAQSLNHVPIEHAELLTLPTCIEYANHVAVMALIPYLREAISDLSLRVFDSRVLMPIFQRGEIQFDVPAPDGARNSPSGTKHSVEVVSASTEPPELP